MVCVLKAFSTPNLNIKNVPGYTQARTLAVLETTFSCVVHPLRSASLTFTECGGDILDLAYHMHL